MTSLRIRLIRKIVKVLARLTIAKFRPSIIGVTGTVGKTSTKEAIYKVLSSAKTTRRNLANLNNELGLPLTILGNYSHSGGVFFWLGVIISAGLRLMIPKFFYWLTASNYPEMLVLEYAADRPGDLQYLIEVARPSVSVVTAVGDIPTHVEFYESADAVALEKSQLVEALPGTGIAVLNADDARVSAMREKTKAKIITYGFSQNAQVRILDLETQIEVDKDTGLPRPTGISLNLQYNGSTMAVRLSGTAGASQAYAAAAAACVGLALNLEPKQIVSALGLYKPPSQRMNFLDGKGNILLVDDSYNASPLATASAIATIKELPAMRKVAILGDMRELGKFSEQAHRQTGRLAAEVFDVIVSIGQDAKFIEAEAKSVAPQKIYHWFADVDSALASIKHLIKEGDLVLVKASHTVGLGKVVAQLRRDKQRMLS